MADAVLDFWDKQAEIAGGEATCPDAAYRELEIARIIECIDPKTESILDVGCGNGYSTLKFAQHALNAKILGVDYSEPMIEEAQRFRSERLRFGVYDILGGLSGKWDVVVSERCLINLSSWEEQKLALLNLRDALSPMGKLILVENTVNGLANLNKLRAQFGLHAITVRWHNRYFSLDQLEPFLGEHFVVKRRENIGNLYYILSRVLHAKLAQDDHREPAYNHPINWIASQLPSLGLYGYSPNYLWELHKRQGD
jgi:SAM-dependent methyltransferase